ncbi:putative GTP-binding protein EngB [compost metagenome]
MKLVLLIVDLRHSPTSNDKMMFDWLKHYDLPMCVVATKADKIPKTRWQKHIKTMKQELGVLPGDNFIPFSSEIGLGKDELWGLIDGYIRPSENESPDSEDAEMIANESQQEESTEA